MPFDVNRGVELPETDEPGTPRTVQAIALAGLSPLSGTAEDIAVAEPIRTAQLILADELLSELRGLEAITEEHPSEAIPLPKVTHAEVQAMQASLNRLRHRTEALWWVAHQDTPIRQLLQIN